MAHIDPHTLHTIATKTLLRPLDVQDIARRHATGEPPSSIIRRYTPTKQTIAAATALHMICNARRAT